MDRRVLTQKQILNILDTCYDKAVYGGLPNTKDCFNLASEYVEKYQEPKKAAKKFINWQIAKCTTSGFLTSLGGLVTLPIAVPVNLTSVWYVQLRMIATLAIIGGFEPTDDSVRTLAYICLTGTSVSKICREAGVQFTNKLTMAMIKKIPGVVLSKINQKVGFRFLTKFGTTGVINLGKMVPVAGSIIGGGVDFIGTRIIAAKAYKIFLVSDIE